MIVIEDKIISEELKNIHFICDLNSCKGACCIEGEGGAPLEKKEVKIIKKNYNKIKPYISQEGINVIEKKGLHYYSKETKTYNTQLIKGKACVFVNYENGFSYCGIEKAHKDKKIDFYKPISCHLYPIRITKYTTYEAVNYEEWDICKAACSLGEKEKVSVYQFLKEPIIRKYGQKFHDALVFAFEK